MVNRTLFLASVTLIVGMTALPHPAAGETRSYPLTGFTGLSVASGVSVKLLEGPFSVTVEADSKPLEEITLKVNKGILEINRKTHFSIVTGPRRDYVVTVRAPALSSISAASGSEINGASLRMEDLTLDVSSGAASS